MSVETSLGSPDTKRQMLRHAVATLAYRSAKCLRGLPEDFANFHAAEQVRTPVQILAHMGDLFDWGLSLAQGKHEWRNAAPLSWREEVDRFFRGLEAFEGYLDSVAPLHVDAEKLFQAPVADALTHLGQIAILRRMAGVPVKGENYFRAKIVAGRVGAGQPPAVQEFD